MTVAHCAHLAAGNRNTQTALSVCTRSMSFVRSFASVLSRYRPQPLMPFSKTSHFIQFPCVLCVLFIFHHPLVHFLATIILFYSPPDTVGHTTPLCTIHPTIPASPTSSLPPPPPSSQPRTSKINLNVQTVECACKNDPPSP